MPENSDKHYLQMSEEVYEDLQLIISYSSKLQEISKYISDVQYIKNLNKLVNMVAKVSVDLIKRINVVMLSNENIPQESNKFLPLEITLNEFISLYSPEKKPWLSNKSQIDIIDVYEAEVTGEKDDDYLIEFRDVEMEIVVASLPKKEFEKHPEPVTAGTPFGIVLYKQQGDPATKIGAWPVEKYWNKSLIN